MAAILGFATPATAQPQAGLHYFALENVSTGFVVRWGAAASPAQAFDNFVLAPCTRYRAWVLAADSLRIGYVEFTSPADGRVLNLAPILLGDALSADSDGDGLHDEGEFVLGTNPADPDSDDDGLLDSQEIMSGPAPAASLLAASTETYRYDSVYRLVESNRDGASTSYTFDAVHNRTIVTGAQNPGAYTRDATAPEPADAQMNQYTSTPQGARVHDRNGNVISDAPGRTITYDYANRMVGFSAPGVTASYRYDALGRRISKTVNSVPTRFFYGDVARVVEEQDGSGDTAATYTHGDYVDDVVEMRRGGQAHFLHTDDLYSTVALSNGLGVLAETTTYADYGKPAAVSALGNPWLFTGRRYDAESGFYDYRTRYFDPLAGRFSSRDAIGLWGDPANFGNAFAYVGNSPASWTDAFGLRPPHLQPENLNPPPDRGYVCYDWVCEQVDPRYDWREGGNYGDTRGVLIEGGYGEIEYAEGMPLQEGDVVFFSPENGPVGHVGIVDSCGNVSSFVMGTGSGTRGIIRQPLDWYRGRSLAQNNNLHWSERWNYWSGTETSRTSFDTYPWRRVRIYRQGARPQDSTTIMDYLPFSG